MEKSKIILHGYRKDIETRFDNSNFETDRALTKGKRKSHWFYVSSTKLFGYYSR